MLPMSWPSDVPPATTTSRQRGLLHVYYTAVTGHSNWRIKSMEYCFGSRG